MKWTVLSVVFLFILVSFANAVPIEISYQGYLTNSGGAPVTGTINITFKLYDGLDAVQWDSGVVAVDVENGVYSVTLGAAPQPAIDPAIFAQDLWLGVVVEGDTEMTPKQKLTSVGFSIRALTADSVADGAVTNATITGPISVTKIEQGPGTGLDADTVDGKHSANLQNRVTGTCGPGSSMTTVNDDGSVVCTPTGLTGTLKNNYVPRSDGTGLVDSAIFDNGNIGLGTSAPSAKLDVFTVPLNTYGSWLPYDAYYFPCEHCSDTCDGNIVAEYACRGGGFVIDCEDIRNSDGEYWEYRTVSCNKVQNAAVFTGNVRVTGGTITGETANFIGNVNVIEGNLSGETASFNGDLTVTGGTINGETADFSGDVNVIGGSLNGGTANFSGNVNVSGGSSINGNGSGLTNVNAELLNGQNSSEIIAAASDGIPPSWHQIIPTAQRFVLVMNDEAVLDRETGLVWERAPGSATFTVFFAQHECNRHFVGGRKGWHLPTIEQLTSLLDETTSSPALPGGHPFIMQYDVRYWTSTAADLNGDYFWSVSFVDGSDGNYSKTTLYRKWCVRGGLSRYSY